MPHRDRRLGSVAGVLAALALAIGWRLLWVQVLNRDAHDNPTHIAYNRSYKLPAQKGDLLDREGRPLARCAQVASIAANPQLVRDPAAVAALVAPVLSLKPEEVIADLSRRWRRQMLRRDVDPAVERSLAPLVQAGVLSFSSEPCDPTYSLYVFPKQFQPAPAERAHLAMILGVSPRELEPLLGSEAGAIRYLDNLDAATAKRIDQLRLAGLLVQQNPVRMVRAAWIEPTAAVIDAVPVDPTQPSVTTARIKDAVWRALTPLWEGAGAPDKSDVEAKLRAPFVYLARQVPLEVGDNVERLIKDHEGGLACLSVHREYAREYPQGTTGRLLLGKADVDQRGVSGLELLYNQMLSGVDGYRKVTVSALGNPIIQEREELVPPVHGKSVELTLDAVIQGYAEEAISQALVDNDADWGLAVVVDPRNGEVLALADSVSAVHHAPPMNRTLSAAYEPGSVVKPLVVAAALEEGLTHPGESFYCGGRATVGKNTLTCVKAHGPETTFGAIRDSCNMVMIQLGARLQQARLDKYFRATGLIRQRTGLGLAGQEATGGIFEHSADGRWSIQKVATVAYGKGIQVTSVGLARAYCALINGGTLPQLHLVRRIRDRDGAILVEQPVEPGPRVFGEQTTAAVRPMLRAVIADKHGTGHIAESKLYDLAGKTGTSIAYASQSSRVVSFVAYAPYEKPRLLVIVSVSEPRAGQRFGSTTCGPAARTIIEKSLQYLNVPPKPQPPAPAAGQVTR